MAKLKEGSTILKHTGEEMITTVEEVDAKFAEKVKTDVPANAKFTDTIYTHPTSAGNKHIPTGGAVGQVLRNISSGTATWQDETVTIINNKTGVINKADIVALGIPSQIYHIGITPPVDNNVLWINTNL